MSRRAITRTTANYDYYSEEHYCVEEGWPYSPKDRIINDCIDAWGVRNALGSDYDYYYYGVVVVVNFGNFFVGNQVQFTFGSGGPPFASVFLSPGIDGCHELSSTPPDWPPMEASTTGREMGRALGLTSASSSADAQGDHFDIMGDASEYWVPSPFFGHIGPGLNAPHRQQLGGIENEQRYTYPGGTHRIVLSPIDDRYAQRMARIPIGDEADHYYTVELRSDEYWDAGLTPENRAVLIHEVIAGHESIPSVQQRLGPPVFRRRHVLRRGRHTSARRYHLAGPVGANRLRDD